LISLTTSTRSPWPAFCDKKELGEIRARIYLGARNAAFSGALQYEEDTSKLSVSGVNTILGELRKRFEKLFFLSSDGEWYPSDGVGQLAIVPKRILIKF
jgi:hypothetical protein